MRDSHIAYGEAYRTHQALVEQLKQAREVTYELEKQVEQGEQKLSRARRLLLEEAQQA